MRIVCFGSETWNNWDLARIALGKWEQGAATVWEPGTRGAAGVCHGVANYMSFPTIRWESGQCKQVIQECDLAICFLDGLESSKQKRWLKMALAAFKPVELYFATGEMKTLTPDTAENKYIVKALGLENIDG